MTSPQTHLDDVPDRWLRTFNQVGLTGSFTEAAELLGVSQPAVSHTIRQLEKALGAAVFLRAKGGVQLTNAGTLLFAGTRPAFEQLDDAVTTARQNVGNDMSVALSVSTSLATYWLMPRLHLFKADHPEIDLRVITNDTDRGVGHDDADLWIPLGLGPWPQLQSWDLFGELVYPVASPDYVEDLNLTSALDSPSHIHLEERYTPRFSWASWASETNSADRTQRGPSSNDYSLVIQSAIDGQGVALGWHHIVGPLIADGLLVRVGTTQVETDAAFPVLAKRGPLRPAARQMLFWLLSEAGVSYEQD